MSSFQTQTQLMTTVIVPVYNGAETLGTCLEALANQTADASCYEVCVVDDGSTDNTVEIAAKHKVSVIRQEHAGAAAARNQGARQSTSQILLFTDADCEPLPTWIEQMLAPFADPTVAGVKGVYRTRQRSLIARFTQAEYEEKYDRLAREEKIDFVDTYAAGYRREVFEAHQGFDPSFQFDEDQEFSFRLAQAGCKLVFGPTAAVYHQHPSSVWEYIWRKVHLGRWKVRVHVRHPAKAIRDSYTPWTQKAQIVLLPLVGGSVIASALGLAPWIVPTLLALMGIVCIVPLIFKAAEQGGKVAMVTPLLALLRALALGFGLAWGIASLSRREKVKSKP